MDTPIQLIVGLGNPGAQYKATRHNAGFWWLDQLAADMGASFRVDTKFRSEVAEIKVQGRVCRLLKPQTFMNLSGFAVQACAHFYKIPVDAILVVHDELDLACGAIKLKWSGGHAGHNGLKDIQGKLACKDYWRLRIGIDHPRNHHGQEVVDYVLGVPESQSKTLIEQAICRSLAIVPLLVDGQLAKAMQLLHS
jgi:PTH1 family peptidyl-tRNA hydrolase